MDLNYRILLDKLRDSKTGKNIVIVASVFTADLLYTSNKQHILECKKATQLEF